MREGGQPLSESARSFFGPRFGHDFSQVRVHTDSRAAESARAFGARAYTIGSHIVFGAGEYQLATSAGRQLLAHELTHTLQQSSDTPKSRVPGSPIGLQKSSPYHIAFACLNPDICDLFTSRGACLPLSCGLGLSGVCGFPSIAIGCCCLGSRGRRPPEQVERDKQRLRERSRRREPRTEPNREQRRVPLPELLLILLMIILLRGAPIMTPRTPGVLPPTFGPPGSGREPLIARRRRSRSEVQEALAAALRARATETVLMRNGTTVGVPQGVSTALRANEETYTEFLQLVEANHTEGDLQMMAARMLVQADQSVLAMADSIVARIPRGVLHDALEARRAESAIA